MERTFMHQCFTGDAKPEDIDDFVERWHASGGPANLATRLGMTSGEYARWVAHPDQLPQIIHEAIGHE
jgi:hypothetical protein